MAKSNKQLVLTRSQSEDEDIRSYALLLDELQELQRDLLALENDSLETLAQVNPRHQGSAANLLHYLGLRRRDIRPLQEKLSAAGLSSLGCAESHVLSNLQACISLLRHALGKKQKEAPPSAIFKAPPNPVLLEENTNSLFGRPPANRNVRILVTLPGDAAGDYALIKEMLVQGMNCARINCAHDNPAVWEGMVNHIRSAQRETGLHCKILMDLSGPKLRTGEVAPGPAVLKWRPQRDVHGKVTSPAHLWLYPEDDLSCPAPVDACIPIRGDWLVQAVVNDRIEFTDSRGASRSLQLVEKVDAGFWAESTQTSYITPGLELHLIRTPISGHSRKVGKAGHVGTLPIVADAIRLQRGDHLIITLASTPGHGARYDETGRLIQAASISCLVPEVFDCVKPGERVLIDDGRIGGVIRNVNPGEIMVEINQAKDGGEKLLADKGINLPDSRLGLGSLTSQDKKHLKFIAQHADIVGLSFVRSPHDVHMLQQHLASLDAEHLGIVLKIETRAAFECLPDLLFALIRSPNVGVMIARGDLAVECGYERLAELQEEIMWLAEAAHLPVIWATQVLEGLAKNGKPSRAEITDAAMGERAECVMLNKGPHIIEAIRALDDILHRMQGHQKKKHALLRRLHW